MHSIEVEDPWFGPYLKVILPGYAPTFWVGPLFKRSIYRDWIKNYGTVARTGNVREKNVTHYWVSGLVTGIPSSAENPQGRIVLSSRGGTFESVMWYSHYYDVYRKYTVTFDVTVSPGDRYATCRCKCDMVYKHYPWESPLITRDTGAFTFRMPVLYDTYARSTTFTTVNISGIPGATGILVGSTVADSACPYSGGTGVDNGLGALNVVDYWVDKTLTEMPRLSRRRDRELRDQALYNAIEGMRLANMNWLTDLTDIASPLAVATQLGSHFTRMPQGLEYIRKMANLHLFWKYVVKTNISTLEQMQVLGRYLSGGAQAVVDIVNRNSVSHGTSSATIHGDSGNTTVTHTVKSVFGSGWSPFATVARLRALGLMPGVADLWDMLPYSFVVDWCIPVQDTVTKLEGLYSALQMDLQHFVHGVKTVRSASRLWQAGTHQFRITLAENLYERTVEHSLPTDMGLGTLAWSDPRKHALTGSALIIQRFL